MAKFAVDRSDGPVGARRAERPWSRLRVVFDLGRVAQVLDFSPRIGVNIGSPPTVASQLPNSIVLLDVGTEQCPASFDRRVVVIVVPAENDRRELEYRPVIVGLRGPNLAALDPLFRPIGELFSVVMIEFGQWVDEVIDPQGFDIIPQFTTLTRLFGITVGQQQ